MGQIKTRNYNLREPGRCAEQNSVDTLLMRPNKWGKVIQCSHPQACFLLTGNQNRGLFILHHARSLLDQDESGMGRFTWSSPNSQFKLSL